MTYETPIGKVSIIDVARISPLDATNLIDESLEKQIQKCVELDSFKTANPKEIERITGKLINEFDKKETNNERVGELIGNLKKKS